VAEQGERFPLAVVDMALPDFCRVLAVKGKCSIVCAENLDEKKVTLDVQSETVEAIIDAMARRCGVQVNRTGNLFFVGQLRPEDKAVLVRRVRRLPPEEVRRAISIFTSGGGANAAAGAVEVYPGGLVVVGDRVEVLRRVDAMLDEVEAVPGVAWVCQLHLVDLSRSLAHDLGVDVTPAVEISLAFAQGSAGIVDAAQKGWALRGALDAVIRAAQSNGGASVVADPLLLMVDGQPGQWQRGDRIPVPRARRTENAGGTETVTDYDYVNAGLLVTTKLREAGQDVGVLDIEIQRSTLTGFRGEAPQTSTDNFKTQCQVESGGVYLLGSLSSEARSSRADGPGVSIGHKADQEDRIVQVWARVYRVAGGLDGGRPLSRPLLVIPKGTTWIRGQSKSLLVSRLR